MWSHVALAVLILFASLAARAQAPAALVGRYQLDVAGGEVLELRADGSATMAGDSTRWSVTGNQLTVGPDGSVAGQSGNSGAMRWRLENLRLLINAGDGRGWQDVNLDATRNSSGSVILHSLGREYAMCR
jgi:hypothetical protein